MFFFFKQKQAYGVLISGGSSGVCSTDLDRASDPIRPVSSGGKGVGAEPAVKQKAEFVAIAGSATERIERKPLEACDPIEPDPQFGCQILKLAAMVDREHRQIGRASCRERVCQYV